MKTVRITPSTLIYHTDLASRAGLPPEASQINQGQFSSNDHKWPVSSVQGDEGFPLQREALCSVPSSWEL